MKLMLLNWLTAILAVAEAYGDFEPSETVSSFRRNFSPFRTFPWKWRCSPERKCVREKSTRQNDGSLYNSVEGCKSVCGPYGSLWPFPTGGVEIGRKLAAFRIEDTAVKLDAQEPGEEIEEALAEAWTIFTRYMAMTSDAADKYKGRSKTDKVSAKRSQVLVKVTVKSSSLKLDLKTDESYTLSIRSKEEVGKPRGEVSLILSAPTFFGARHGLETLSQLVTFDPVEQCYRMPGTVTLSDRPSYPYRGILLDTGRNYYSVQSLRRIIDGMSYNKLNVLHWHMNEQQSFPFVSERVPNLTIYGAYSNKEVYYKDEIMALVMYGRQRGVMLLPEFDAPAHASYGWQFGPDANLGNLVTCFDEEWQNESGGTIAVQPPAGQLNPVNPNVFKILSELYRDLVEAFTPVNSKSSLTMFHMGGDEVSFECWHREREVVKWLESNNFDTDPDMSKDGYNTLWSLFQNEALQRLTSANRDQKFRDGAILWTSELTNPAHVSRFLDASKYVLQVWSQKGDRKIAEWLKMHYRLILSNNDAWYFDCGFDAWLYSGPGPDANWCSPFKGWKTVYMNSPQDFVHEADLDWSVYGKLMLGGEATIWSEQIDEFSVETRLWPRGCALAERLWSDPRTSGWRDAEPRILEQRHRMSTERDIRADKIQPEFCRQNEGSCFIHDTGEPVVSFYDESGDKTEKTPPAVVGEKSRSSLLNEPWLWVVATVAVATFLVSRRKLFSRLLGKVKFISIR